jgi:hypothetical protein
MCFWRQIER